MRIVAISILSALVAAFSFPGNSLAQFMFEPEAKAPKVTLKALAVQVNALQSTVTSLKSTVTALQSQVSTQDSQLSSAISALQGTVTSLQSTVTALQTNLTALQTNVTALQTSVSGVQTKLSSQGAQNAFQLGKFMTADNNGNIGVGTATPERYFSLAGNQARNLGMDSNSGGAGNAFMINAGAAGAGSADLPGGDLVLAAGTGNGLGGSGNARMQTAGAEDASGATGNTLVDREIMVGKAKALTLAAPGFTSLMSIHLTGTHTAGGRIFYSVRATDGGSQIATEEGVIQYLATANSITCTVQTADKLHLGTVNSGCTPGFFNPGSQPGISIFDNVSFSSPAPIAVHEVYFKVENESGAPIRLEP